MNISMMLDVSNFFEVLAANPIIIALLVLGLIFCIVEAVIPGFGVFGILGIASEVGAVVYHAIVSKDALQVLILVAFLLLITLLIFLFLVRSARFGLLGKTPFIEKATALPLNYDKDIEVLKDELLGREGIVIVECRPVGKIKIGETSTLEVLSKSGMVEKGAVVKIVEVEGPKIFVEKVER